MKYCGKSLALAILSCGVALAAILTFDPLQMNERLEADLQSVMDLVMKPHTLSRYIPAEVYEKLGLNPSTRLMNYHWDNCGNKTTENFLIHDITFSPDPITFPGQFAVSFNLNINTDITIQLKASVLLEKKIGSSWIEVPCIANIGSCTYQDLCVILGQIAECPPEFKANNIPCKCPFNKGEYKLPKATFQVDGVFLPPGDYHIRANLTHLAQDGGCYDIYASFG